MKIEIDLTPEESNAVILALWAAAKRDDALAKKLGGQANIDQRKASAEKHRALADRFEQARATAHGYAA